MFACPEEPDYVIYTVDGISFRSHKASLAGADQGFVEETNDYKFTATINVPDNLVQRVVGKGKANIKNLRRSTKTKIIIREGDSCHHLIISAPTKEILNDAVTQVQEHVDSIAQNGSFTHFICIPCVTDQAFVDGCKSFLKLFHNSCALNADAFDNLNRLHLTLLTLALNDEDSINKASQIMSEVVKEYDWTEDKEMEISGINVFGNGEDGPRLFYAQPRGNDATLRLRELQQVLATELRQKGIQVIEVNDIFHITLLRKSWTLGSMWGNPTQLETAAEFRLPAAPLKEVALCRRYLWEKGKFYFVHEHEELHAIKKKGQPNYE